ncbi:sulfite exporter TauE/SafE family protein [Candidatus Woesearchaeota archaeon]|nr:sulfite exporter TauE/SafE family protein [Candidatus Woesearchaeota archaeon]
MPEPLFYLAAFAAEIFGTLAGFGSSTIFLPLALFFVDFPTALILVALFHVFGNLGRITFFREGINWKLLLWFGVPSIILTAVGAILVRKISLPVLEGVLGIFLMLFSIISFLKPKFSLPKNKKSIITGGILSGFFAGLIGTGGALRGAFLASFHLKKNIYIATLAVIALVVDFTRIPIYLGSGFLQREFYGTLPWLLLVAVLGAFAGKKLVDKIPQELFRKLVLAAILVMGVWLLWGIVS